MVFDIIVLFFFVLFIFEDLIILSWVFIFLEFGKFFRNIGVLKYIFLDEIDFLLRIFLFFLYIVYFFWLLNELLILVVKGFRFCMYVLIFFKIFLFWNFIKLIKFKIFCNILLIIVWRIFVWCFCLVFNKFVVVLKFGFNNCGFLRKKEFVVFLFNLKRLYILSWLCFCCVYFW